MFRFLSLLFLAIFLVDLVVDAIETRRVWVMGSIVLKRKTAPIRYWAMTALWSLVALGCVLGVFVLLYQAIAGSGPYKDHAFFSLHQAWPYAATSLLFGWLTIKILRGRLWQLQYRGPAA
ncbi:hypothetical protein [Pseudoxanthomonas sp. PXM01]|uniref:hypothetical protein n=1 Tax=Pseudoxanthomonas sp. PXM01 TaxID=2769295 RepID=UPI00177C7C48|nr:hypothetical protein [Pseudoxanthomonas sp. PXM01]MBD9467421.1 hypothetical protein [Pseudoxanthomonas sp. PXM01]